MKSFAINFIRKKYNNIVLFLIICLSVFLKLLLLGEGIKNGIILSNTLDFSWSSDAVERLLHGYIAGKDFIFTYGPLYQLLQSLPAFIFNQRSYISVLFAPFILLTISIILLFLICKYLTTDKKEQITLIIFLIFFVNLLALDANLLFRITVPFVYAIIYYKFISSKKTRIFQYFILSLVPPILGLYIFDLFAICLLINILLSISKCFEFYINNQKKYSSILFTSMVLIILAILFELTVSILLTGNTNYILYSVDTVTNYRFIMNIPFSFSRSFVLLIFPLALFSLLIYFYKKTKFPKNFKNTFTVLTIVSFIQLSSAFIRSDEAHIIMGIYPSLIVSFTLLFFILKERLRLGFIIILTFLYILIPYREHYYPTISIQYLKSAMQLLNNNKPFFELYKMPANYYFSKQDFNFFKKLIEQNPEKVMIYPYDSYILNIFNTTYNTFPLQFYQYSGSPVEEESVRRLKQSSPKFIILGIDTKSALNLDDIPNLSRNPLITKWMIAHYSVFIKTNNYLIIKLDPKKENLTNRALNKNCTIYEINSSQIIKQNLFDMFPKPSFFYLKKPLQIHLPYTSNTKDFLIIENYNNTNEITKLFEQHINFNQNYIKLKNIEYVKKYPIPKFKETIKTSAQVRCYN